MTFEHRSPRGFDNRAKRLLHILGHLHLVLAPLPMEAQNWNSPSVNNIGINLAVCFLVRNHLAASTESNGRAIRTAALLLQRSAIAFILLAHAIKVAHARHSWAASELDMVAA